MPLMLTLKARGQTAALGPSGFCNRPLSIDLCGITPDRMGTLSLDGILRLPVAADGRACELGELFSATGAATDGQMECSGDFSAVHHVGAAMAWGEISVRGDVGRHAGAAMSGGTLTVAGNAGDWLAAEMTGGTVRIAGNAGDNAAAALPGSNHGLGGGMVLIQGNAGCLAGTRMRRGFLVIGGSCGPGTILEMRAGTAIVAGAIGAHAGLHMQRGTLISLLTKPNLPPTFKRGARWSPPFMPLLASRLQRGGYCPAGHSLHSLLSGDWQQWHGDTLSGGRGEIFHR